MADYHQLVDQIRAFVQASDQTRTAILESLASSYAGACVDVNQRMGRCHRLLQQGLRSEAIQLAESEPKLLDSLTALDFPERADWDELVQIYQLAAAPKLAVEQAQFLNEAYAQEDPLQDLLHMHRRLALQRAPVKSRIAVMRKLAAQDSTNPVWNDDLRVFEKARFREVQSEAAVAAQNRNVTAISQLAAEIEQQTWVEPPPKTLVQGLRKADAQFRGQQTRSLLNDLDARLNDAFAARDPIRGRLVRQEWIALTAVATLAPTDPVWDRVRPALNWLEEEDRQDELRRAHQETLTALAQVLDDSKYVPPAELERLAHAVLQFGQGMPEAMQHRYVSRLRTGEAAQRHRRWTIISAAAAGIALAGSLAFYTIRSWTRASDAGRAAGAINGMIELGEIEEAHGFLEKLRKADAGLFSYPPMIVASQKFEAIREKETNRVVQFDNALRAAEQAPIDQINPSELETARKLARQDAEKRAIAQVVERRAAALATERARYEKELAPRLDGVGRKIADVQHKVESMAPDKVDFAPLTEARRELADLAPVLPLAGEHMQGLATALGQKIDATNALLEKRRKQGQLKEDITDAVAFSVKRGADNMSRFSSLLDDYVKLFPDDALARNFTQIRDEHAIWRGVDEWNRLVEGWKAGPAEAAPQGAKARAEQCERFLAQHPGTPDAAEIATYQKHLEAIHRRSSGADSAASKIERLLSDILVANLWMLKVRDSETTHKKYYLDSKPRDNAVTIRYFVDFNAKKRGTPIAGTSIISSDWSPQTKIANSVKPIVVQNVMRSDWDRVMIDLAEQLRAEPDIDPVLQVALLRSVLEQAAAGSEPLREALTTIRGALGKGGVNVDVCWMDPDNEDARKMRYGAQFLVQSLPPFSGAFKQARARRDQIERQVKRFPRPVGWLSHDHGRWRIRCKFLPPSPAELWVVVPKADKRGEWRKIGTVTQNKETLDENGESMKEGRPVFAM